MQYILPSYFPPGKDGKIKEVGLLIEEEKDGNFGISGNSLRKEEVRLLGKEYSRKAQPVAAWFCLSNSRAKNLKWPCGW